MTTIVHIRSDALMICFNRYYVDNHIALIERFSTAMLLLFSLNFDLPRSREIMIFQVKHSCDSMRHRTFYLIGSLSILLTSDVQSLVSKITILYESGSQVLPVQGLMYLERVTYIQQRPISARDTAFRIEFVTCK